MKRCWGFQPVAADIFFLLPFLLVLFLLILALSFRWNPSMIIPSPCAAHVLRGQKWPLYALLVNEWDPGQTVRRGCLARATRAILIVPFGYESPMHSAKPFFPFLWGWNIGTRQPWGWGRRRRRRLGLRRPHAWSSAITAMTPPCSFQKYHHLLTGAPPYLMQLHLGDQHCVFKLQKSCVSSNGQVRHLQIPASEYRSLFWATAWQPLLGSHKRAIGPSLASHG